MHEGGAAGSAANVDKETQIGLLELGFKNKPKPVSYGPEPDPFLNKR